MNKEKQNEDIKLLDESSSSDKCSVNLDLKDEKSKQEEKLIQNISLDELDYK